MLIRSSISTCAAAATLAITGTTLAQGLEGALDPDRWLSDGIGGAGGFTEVLRAVEFSYAVSTGPNDPDGIPFRTAEFSNVAARDAAVGLQYQFSGDHALHDATAHLALFADSPSGRQIIPLVDDVEVAGSFQFHGLVAIDITAGFEWGIIVGGQNADALGSLTGDVILFQLGEVTADSSDVIGFDGAFRLDNWSIGSIEEGTTSANNAVEVLYFTDILENDTQVGSGNCEGFLMFEPEMTNLENYATCDGMTTFSWFWSGSHQFFNTYGRLRARTGASTTTLVEDCNTTFGGFTRSGSATIGLSAGELFGIDVTGGHLDGTGTMSGSVVIHSLSVQERCVIDINGDGFINSEDFFAFLNGFINPACP